jgi:hypothetical protein
MKPTGMRTRKGKRTGRERERGNRDRNRKGK